MSGNDRNRRKRKNQKRGEGQQSQEQHLRQARESRRHMTFDELPVPQVSEPRPVCRICGEPIEFIAESISEADGGFSHFDCVVERIRGQEDVKEGEYVSYIGHGNFAVFTKDGEGHFTIKTRVPYESKESYDGAKKYVEGTKV